jgi:hypothetical protein
MSDDPNPPTPPVPTDPELSARLNRKELRVCRALDELAIAADDLPGFYWFSEVFAGYMRPQSDNRKMELRALLCAAIKVLDQGVFEPKERTPSPTPSPTQPPQPIDTTGNA